MGDPQSSPWLFLVSQMLIHDLNSLGYRVLYPHDLGNLPDVAHVIGFRSFQAAPVDRSARSSARALGLADAPDLGFLGFLGP